MQGRVGPGHAITSAFHHVCHAAILAQVTCMSISANQVEIVVASLVVVAVACELSGVYWLLLYILIVD